MRSPRTGGTAARGVGAVTVALLATLGLVAPAQAAENDTTLVSRAGGPTGTAANDWSDRSSISADGRFVVFVSQADNLSSDDNNGVANLFVRDLQAGTTTWVSRADGATGVAADADSTDPSISADGRYVAFVSTATNLSDVDLDTCDGLYYMPGPCPDIFVRDLTAGSTTLVSRVDGAAGTAATGASFVPTIFPDGGQVIFTSVATNLGAPDTDECTAGSETGPYPAPCLNVFVRDVRAGTTRYVAPGRHQVQYEGCRSAVSGDGRLVTVETDQSLDPADPGPGGDELYVIDLQTGAKQWASGPRAGGAWGAPFCASLSADGRAVAFVGSSSQLDGGIGGTVWHEVYVRNLTTGVTTVVSRPTNEFNKYSSSPSISGDGRFVAFGTEKSISSNGPGVYVRDLEYGTATFVSRASGADGAPAVGYSPSMSADGRVVAFSTDADNISPVDNDLYRNVFVRELGAAAPVGGADLSVSLTASSTTPKAGSEVTYTVTVANAGPAGAGGITVGGSLPWGPSLVSAAPSQGTYQPETGLWTVGSIAAGATATLRVVGKAAKGTTTVTAEVTGSDTPDPDSTPLDGKPTEDDQASVTITTSAPACASVTATADADSWVAENTPAATNGASPSLAVLSKASANQRALVHFALPTVPAGCAVTSATLRLNAASAKNGRTLQAVALAAPWTESVVTWSNQPSTTGTAATTASGTGWRQWTVTAQVKAMYTGANHGFLIRDASEGAGSAAAQSFRSREGGGRTAPQLVVTFG